MQKTALKKKTVLHLQNQSAIIFLSMKAPKKLENIFSHQSLYMNVDRRTNNEL